MPKANVKFAHTSDAELLRMAAHSKRFAQEFGRSEPEQEYRDEMETRGFSRDKLDAAVEAAVALADAKNSLEKMGYEEPSWFSALNHWLSGDDKFVAERLVALLQSIDISAPVEICDMDMGQVMDWHHDLAERAHQVLGEIGDYEVGEG